MAGPSCREDLIRQGKNTDNLYELIDKLPGIKLAAVGKEVRMDTEFGQVSVPRACSIFPAGDAPISEHAAHLKECDDSPGH